MHGIIINVNNLYHVININLRHIKNVIKLIKIVPPIQLILVKNFNHVHNINFKKIVNLMMQVLLLKIILLHQLEHVHGMIINVLILFALI